ncbi:AraC family transcriptional regulator [Stutzerimonas azotifigens]|uniref:AraC family transcriptional regulator n=1 Tax=Stutzerimonas azotifigens TaxID=291995 RepID=UPI00040A4C14|nr:AraC family transcriptional regulator [Stutzerimonas azotifigens]
MTASLPVSRFWRDDALPHLELRSVRDGRQVCHARHAHETFSVGLVTGGRSSYLNGTSRQHIGAGTLVLMNPGDVHACNPLGDRPWAYHMLYVDAGWLGELQQELDGGTGFRPFRAIRSDDAELRTGLSRLVATLTSEDREPLARQGAAVEFFSQLHQRLQPGPAFERPDNRRLARAAEYIAEQHARPLRLEDICREVGLSPAYLVRAFKARYGMTPHAYLINRRVQVARARLRQGRPIADAALEAGFADQAHLQRAFKQLLAATPGHYRRAQPSSR